MTAARAMRVWIAVHCTTGRATSPSRLPTLPEHAIGGFCHRIPRQTTASYRNFALKRRPVAKMRRSEPIASS
jgi:hypothetical protein